MENNYLITQKDLNDVVKYLFTRPYAEVANFVGMLSQLPKLDPQIKPDFVKEGDKKK
tara:strand:+ start:2283 stop:2453 length:171 start_codon:yes stop_codon:yes gene_type:complete